MPLPFKHHFGVQVSELDTINGQLADGKFAVNDIERRCRAYYISYNIVIISLILSKTRLDAEASSVGEVTLEVLTRTTTTPKPTTTTSKSGSYWWIDISKTHTGGNL